MALRVSPQQLGEIRRHGSRDYPNECCGVLLGTASGTDKVVNEVVALGNLRSDSQIAQKVLPLANLQAETERNRYLIDPRDQLRVEKDARRRGLDVLGYYHSHPDHPARPSNYDRDHAWPWYSYVILSVEKGESGELTSWVLANDRSIFQPEQLEVNIGAV